MSKTEESHVKTRIKEKLQKKLDSQINSLTDETIKHLKNEYERLDVELSDDEREHPIMDETVRELYVTSLERQEIVAPYGYYLKKNKLHIKEEEARKVKIIFSWFYKHKKSFEEISEKVQLTISKIKHIVSNPLYLGKIQLNGEIKKGKHPAIIDENFCKFFNINPDEITQQFLIKK